MAPNEHAGGTMGMSTKGRASSNLPPPAASGVTGASASGTSHTASHRSGPPLSSKNWTVRPVVTKRDTLPSTHNPEHEQDLPALWSVSKWGDVRRQKVDPTDGKRARVETNKISSAERKAIARELHAKETELKKKLAAYASFNQSERDLLRQAFAQISVEQQGVVGLCSRSEFAEVWDRLGTRLTPKVTNAFFAKYGEDRTGRMPVDLFITAVLESRNRVLAMEEKRSGAYLAGQTKEYKFNGRVKYFPCRRGVYAPSAWDPNLAARSAKPPKEGLTLEWVYGYGGLQNTANNLFYNEDDHAVFYTAGVGIVFDRHAHKQYFFHGHDDDIKCMAMHPAKRLVATGQVGNQKGCPIVCVWDTTVNKKTGQIRGKVAQLPFENVPAVVALAFSNDGDRLVAITNDTNNTVHVFDWKAADQTLATLANTRKGAPTELVTAALQVNPFPGLITVGKGGKSDSFPHVAGVSWNPYGKYDKYDELKNEWSEFVTYGAKHVRLWRLHHADENDKIGFYGKDGKPGLSEVGLFTPVVRPCDVMSVAWLPPRGEDAKLYGGAVLVTGTRCGSILLWHTGKKGLQCAREIEAHDKGPLVSALVGGGVSLSGVRAMTVRDDGETLVTAGGDGKVLWWATAALTGATRSKSFTATPHTTRVLVGDDNKTPPCIRSMDCHKHSSDVMLGTLRCDIWEIDDVNGAHPMAYGHSGDVKALAVHPIETHVFATGSESGKLQLWNAKLKMLKAKVTLHHPAVSCAFSPDGKHVAVGCKDGCLLILSYKNIVTGQFKQVVQRPQDDSRCEFHHCNEAIETVQYSPDGSLLAVGSRDTFIDVYDVTGSAVPGRSVGVMYHRLHRLNGHSSYITHIDWSSFDKKNPDRHVLQSTDGAHELLYHDCNSGKQVRESLRDERWDTQTCTLGFSVMGIWPDTNGGAKAADATGINALDRGPVPGRDALGRRHKGELLATVDDSGKVKLFNYPCVVKHAPFRAMRWRDVPGLARKPTGTSEGYTGHSQNVTNVKFANEGAHVITTGGFDRSVMQWRVDEDAIETKGHTKRTKEPRPYVTKQPLPKVLLPRGGDGLTTEERDALASALLEDDAGTAKQEKETLCDYLVTVTTGDAKGASTDAAVVFSAFGEAADGRTLVIRETVLDNAPDNFSRGGVDVFKVTASDIGTLTHLKIGHNDSGDSPGWLLQSVNLSNITKGWETTLFPRGVWLDKQRGGETHCTLCPSEHELRKHNAAHALVDQKFFVTVTTTDTKGAGTDANVWIELFGEFGKASGARNLDNAADNFCRGRVDKFELDVAGMGAGITKARIGHDNSGFGPGWCVEHVDVLSVSTNETVSFDLPASGLWLEARNETGTSCEIFPKGKHARRTVAAQTRYKIEVHTADTKAAGTDANVWLELVGENGNSGRLSLSTSRQNFERGASDVFFVKAADVGTLLAVKIGHDSRGASPGWCLDRVLVSLDSNLTSTTFDAGVHGVTIFDAGAPGKPGGRWLDATSDEGVTSVTLTPSGSLISTHKFYKVAVNTSDVLFAGTDANVFVTLIGVRNGVEVKSNQFKLGDSNSFQRGALDTFEIGPVSQEFDSFVAIELGHDGVGVGSGWRCDSVAVWDIAAPTEKHAFPVQGWLDKNQAPHKTNMVISIEGGDPKSASTIYRIETVTGDRDGAGTGARVSLSVFGADRDTGFLPLNTHGDDETRRHFQRGGTDSFTLAQAKNVGDITHVVLRHDESRVNGGDPSWFVQSVKIHNVSTNATTTFAPRCWIGKDREPHFSSEVVLTPEGEAEITLVTYRVTTRTSDLRYAGTEAVVSVRLIGAEVDGKRKKTSMKKLDNDSNNFERGASNVFLLEDIDIGELASIEIGHHGVGTPSDWHLSSVEVSNLDGSSRKRESSKNENAKLPQTSPTFFHHNEWIKSGAGPVSIRKEDGGSVKKLAKYEVQVRTSDTRFAGTDSTVTVKIVGELNGEATATDFAVLENSPNNFARGKEDVFFLELANVGEVTGCVVKIDTAAGDLCAWRLLSVGVTNLSVDTGREPTVWHHDSWLDEAAPFVTFDATSLKKKKFAKYVVETQTGDKKGAGTDANVFLTLFGADGSVTDVLPLENARDNFRKGKNDVFHVEAVDVGSIQKIRLAHDGAAPDAAWHCASLAVTNCAYDTGMKFVFKLNKWFDETKPPGLISQVFTYGDDSGYEDDTEDDLLSSEDGTVAEKVVLPETGFAKDEKAENFASSPSLKPVSVEHEVQAIEAKLASTKNDPEEDEKAPSPRRDTVPVPVPVPNPVTPAARLIFTDEKTESPEARETREFAELEAQVIAEAEAELQVIAEGEAEQVTAEAEAEQVTAEAEAEQVTAEAEAQSKKAAEKTSEAKKSMASMSLRPSRIRREKKSGTSLLNLASASSSKGSGKATEPSPSPVKLDSEFEITISRDPVDVPLKVRVLGKGGEAVAVVPKDAAFASFKFPAPLEFVTKVYVSFSEEEGEKQPGDVSVALQRVFLSDPSQGHTCVFELHGTVLDSKHKEVRVLREATSGLACEEWEEAVAKKDEREKKYWFSQQRNESVWKEPSKYYPVRFPQPDV